MVFLSKLQLVPLNVHFLPSAVSRNAESEELGGGTRAVMAAGNGPIKLMTPLKEGEEIRMFWGKRRKSGR